MTRPKPNRLVRRTPGVRGALLLLLAGCGAPAAPVVLPDPPSTHFGLLGGNVVGIGSVDVEIEDGRIARLGELPNDVDRLDVAGSWIVPAFIDSHVHLAYWRVAEELADGGVAGAVDLASPVEFLSEDHAPLRVVASGPMVTAPNGYPLSSWGADGYGTPCTDAATCVAAVDELHRLGAGVIKIPLAGGPELDDESMRAAIDRAHALGLQVATHALGDEEALRAARAGADVLAHVPTERLSDETVEAWRGRAVVPTLDAFGGGEDAIENVRDLRDHDVQVLYGTDLGNTRDAGTSIDEISLMIAVGMNGRSILDAGTRDPAAYWGFSDLGSLEPGKAASFLVLSDDPLRDPTVLASPAAVWIDGVRR